MSSTKSKHDEANVEEQLLSQYAAGSPIFAPATVPSPAVLNDLQVAAAHAHDSPKLALRGDEAVDMHDQPVPKAVAATGDELTLISLLGRTRRVRLEVVDRACTADADQPQPPPQWAPLDLPPEDPAKSWEHERPPLQHLPATAILRVLDAKSGKVVTEIDGDQVLNVTRALAGFALPRVLCMSRLERMVALMDQIEQEPLLTSHESAAASRFAVHVLRHKVPRKLVDTAHPQFESWTFAAASPAAAAAWIHRVRRAVGWRAPRGKCLIVANPFSGKRKAMSTVRMMVLPLLKVAQVEVEVIVTTGPGHATSIANALAIDNYYCAFLAGGDGIVHEFWNGLLSRPDWGRARLLPLAHIAAGTGNALAASLNLVSAAMTVLAAIKGWARPLDMLAVYQDRKSPQGTMVPHRLGMAHLSVMTGFIADLDIDSEVLRVLGPLRSDIWAVYGMVRPKFYGYRLAYVLDEDSEQAAATAAHSAKTTPDLMHVPEVGPQPQLATVPWSALTAAGSGWTVHAPNRYFMVNAQNLPHLSIEFNGAPHARMHDGVLDLLWADGDIKPMSLLPYMLDQSAGTHILHPRIHRVKARAVALIPLHPDDPEFDKHFGGADGGGGDTNGVNAPLLTTPGGAAGLARNDPAWNKTRRTGHLVIDGENEPYGAVRIEVHPELATVICARDLDEAAFARQVKQAAAPKGTTKTSRRAQ
ncbi:Sphingosine kinase 1 [Allomyces arbusculus]|nr:Sphingosine kinase 1 [Allomyces arbusculus]